MNVGKPLLENIFGENNTIKVLDFLLMGKELDFTITHVSKGTGLSRTAVRNSINKLIKKKLISISREDDKSKYYNINKTSNKYRILDMLYTSLKQDVISS